MVVDWDAVLAFLKAVDWQVVASVATAGALLVSAGVFRIQLIDRRRLRAVQDRSQADHVAGWLTFNHEDRSWTAYLKNGSTLPIYDVAYIVRDLNDEDTDVAMPEFISVVPPDTMRSWSPIFFGLEFFSAPEEDAENDSRITILDSIRNAIIYLVGDNEHIGSVRDVESIRERASEGHINQRAYLTFRDGRGLSWQRDTHGRLSPFKRRIDWAPKAARITGRISWWRRGGHPWYK